MCPVFFWNIFLWIAIDIINVQYIKSLPQEQFTIGYKDMKEGHLSCVCGKLEKIREKDLDVKTAQKLFREVLKDKDFLKKINNYQEVKEFADCLRCNLTYINCNEKLCVKKGIKFSHESSTSQTSEATVTSETFRTFGSTAMRNHESVSFEDTSSNSAKKYSESLVSAVTSNSGGRKESTGYAVTSSSSGKENSESIIKTVSSVGELNKKILPESTMPEEISTFSEIMSHVANKSKNVEEPPADSVQKVVDIPIGGRKNHSRTARHIGCSYPTAMETAAISCRVYPSSIKCVQRCAFGYTLESGIKREMHCKFSENRWIPVGFKECVPFVDCRVTLTSGGSATCSQPAVDMAPVCKVECAPYEDKPAVPAAEYTCKIDGKWEPALPFCVIPGSGLVLAPPPRVKLHTEN